MRYLITLLLLLLPSVCFGFGVGTVGSLGSGVASDGPVTPEIIGDNLSGGTVINWSSSVTYFCKINGVPSRNGTLIGYQISMASSSGDRQVKLALYTHNSDLDRPDTLVSGSETGEIYYTASNGDIVNFSPLGSASISNGATYWIGFKENNYGKPFGATTGGTCLKATTAPYTEAFGVDWATTYTTNIFTDTSKPNSWAIISQ